MSPSNYSMQAKAYRTPIENPRRFNGFLPACLNQLDMDAGLTFVMYAIFLKLSIPFGKKPHQVGRAFRWREF
jgi:hypothetical protein